MPKKAYSTVEVAEMAGVHRDTLLRWLRQGLIQEPTRDRHGWRVFRETEARSIAQFANSSLSTMVKESVALYGWSSEFEKLESIDWDFVNAKTNYLTHGLHPYPAKFIPQIPNALIQELSSVGETVADIFCGSGTTLVEALTLKRNAIGIDANPLACLISAAKTTRFQDNDTLTLSVLADKALQLAGSVSLSVPNLFGTDGFNTTAFRPDNKALSFWFDPFIVEELAEILSWCRALPTESAKNVALTAFSSIIISVSKQDSDTRYVRREKKLSAGDAFRRFAQALSDSIRAVTELTELVEPRFTCKIHHSDVLAEPEIGPVDLVVCSPPYPNAYSYHLYHMTRLVWLGMDQKKFKREEIGSHRKYSSRGTNGATARTFRNEMGAVFKWLRKFLKPGKFACFVVGDSTVRGEKISNVDLISGVAAEHGLVELTRILRRLQDTKKAFNPTIGKIKEEQILILRNLGG
ncbi:MAG: MerR family DNA-binding transcriptional regulator [Deltaproteobacteria bacterium]|nr:MerR family DNA-binding transcriptional regulator [Deltaproteobacteria bacterium]